jgi:diguanylate cyclase (GGDEF)-like protein
MVSVDINGLKSINDYCGHACGDEYIRIVAECLKESCRADDVIARMGGDEFEIILPHTSAEQAESVRLRIIQHCANRTVSNRPVSIAIGYATKTKADESITMIRKLADQRIYLSKEHR